MKILKPSSCERKTYKRYNIIRVGKHAQNK